MFEKEQETTPCPGEEAAPTEEPVRIKHTNGACQLESVQKLNSLSQILP